MFGVKERGERESILGRFVLRVLRNGWLCFDLEGQ